MARALRRLRWPRVRSRQAAAAPPTLLSTMEASDSTELPLRADGAVGSKWSLAVVMSDALPRTSEPGKGPAGGPDIVSQPLAVVGPEGELVPQDAQTIGEVWLRGNNVTLGYFEDPEQTEASYGGGWFRTATCGLAPRRRSAQGPVRDIIISGAGSARSVEQVLASRRPEVPSPRRDERRGCRWPVTALGTCPRRIIGRATVVAAKPRRINAEDEHGEDRKFPCGRGSESSPTWPAGWRPCVLSGHAPHIWQPPVTRHRPVTC
jgi:hypothetical protein